MTNKKNSNTQNNKGHKLAAINPDAAGIDIGSREHYVCVSEDRDPNNVQIFKAFTGDLKLMANWLVNCNHLLTPYCNQLLTP